MPVLSDSTKKIRVMSCHRLLKERFDFLLEDTPGNDTVMRMIGSPVFRRMAESVLTSGKEAIDELPVLLIVLKIEMHPINRRDYLLPPLTP